MGHSEQVEFNQSSFLPERCDDDGKVTPKTYALLYPGLD